MQNKKLDIKYIVKVDKKKKKKTFNNKIWLNFAKPYANAHFFSNYEDFGNTKHSLLS